MSKNLIVSVFALLILTGCGGSSSSVTSPTNTGGVTVTPLHGTMTLDCHHRA